MAGKFAAMEDGTTKTALAVQLFGRSGAALIPFLNQGRDGIQRMLDISKELGLTWSGNDAAAAKKFAEQVDLLTLQAEAFKEKLAIGVMPALNTIAAAFIRVDGSGRSLATTLGQDIGSALLVIAKGSITAVAGLQELYYALKLMKVQWSEGQTGPGTAAIFAEFDRIQKNWEKRMEQMAAGFSFSLSDKNRGPAPALIDVAQVKKDLDQITATMVKAQEFLAAHSEDFVEKMGAPYEKMVDQLIKLNPHTMAQALALQGVVDQIEKLKATHLDLEWEKIWERSTGSRISRARSLAGMGFGPTANSGIRRVSARASRPFAEDTEAQNKKAAGSYDQVRTAGEQWAEELTKLNFLLDLNARLKAGLALICRRITARCSRKRTRSTGAYDPPSAKPQQCATMRNSKPMACLPAVADPGDATRPWTITTALHGAAQHGDEKPGSGIGAALNDFSKSMGTFQQSLNRGMTTALGGLHNSFSTFFRDILNGTKTIGQAFANLGMSILDSMASAFAGIIADWIMTHVVIAALNAIFGEDFVGTAAKTKESNAMLAASAAALAGLIRSPLPA